MSHSTRGTVYALLVAIGLLLAGVAVLVWVDSRRVRRYSDEINALHYRLDSQEVEIRRLRKQTQPGTSTGVQNGTGSTDTESTSADSGKADNWN